MGSCPVNYLHAVNSLEAIANFCQLTRILLQHRSLRKRPGSPHTLFEFLHLLGEACPRRDPVLERARSWVVFDLSSWFHWSVLICHIVDRRVQILLLRTASVRAWSYPNQIVENHLPISIAHFHMRIRRHLPILQGSGGGTPGKFLVAGAACRSICGLLYIVLLVKRTLVNCIYKLLDCRG